MKSQNLFIKYLGLFCLSGFMLLVSCQKEDLNLEDLKFGSETYYISVGRESSILILEGNGDYELTAIDNSLFSTRFEKNKDGGTLDYLWLDAKKKGRTSLKVRDKRINKTVYLTIQVVDPFAFFLLSDAYLNITYKKSAMITEDKDKMIRAEVKKRIGIDGGSILLMQKAKASTFKVFKGYEHVKPEEILRQGTFSLDLSKASSSYLNLQYADQEKARIFQLIWSQSTAAPALQFLSSGNSDPKKANLSKIDNLLAESRLPHKDYYFNAKIDLTEEMKAYNSDIELVQGTYLFEILIDKNDFTHFMQPGLLNE